MQLANRLSEYVRACFTGIWIESHEHQDALTEIATLCREEQWQLATWDIGGAARCAPDASGAERRAGGRYGGRISGPATELGQRPLP